VEHILRAIAPDSGRQAMTLDNLVLQALKRGSVSFEDDRFARVYDLRFVRPVVGGEKWSLITGADQVPLRWWTHLALEIARAFTKLEIRYD
jgi:hypothetical protein